MGENPNVILKLILSRKKFRVHSFNNGQLLENFSRDCYSGTCGLVVGLGPIVHLWDLLVQEDLSLNILNNCFVHMRKTFMKIFRFNTNQHRHLLHIIISLIQIYTEKITEKCHFLRESQMQLIYGSETKSKVLKRDCKIRHKFRENDCCYNMSFLLY